MAIKFCVDCGTPFESSSPGASDIRDKNCNKKTKSFLTEDIYKYKTFKNNLRKPKDFASEDQAVTYYHQQLNLLLKMANRSWETLLSEKAAASLPSDEAEIASLISDYLEEVQGI